ncbi:MAG: thioredoxin domain-containing protein [Candidatus Gracilibacteria bacterium]|nr:thioredoxin domain-containing protein [Candidatus Gracilibacteria bacterium]
MGKYIVLLFSLVFLASCTGVVTNTSPTQNTSGATVGIVIDAPTYGSGTHQIEYYADFQCPACINFSHTFLPVLEELAAAGKATITYKQFPLTRIHKNAYRDSLAFYCAVEQNGKFMDYKKALYALEEKKAGATVSDDERVAAADGLGIDTVKFSSCLKENTYAASVDRDVADGDAARVNATPTVILDGTKLDFSIFSTVDDFKSQMDRILSK